MNWKLADAVCLTFAAFFGSNKMEYILIVFMLNGDIKREPAPDIETCKDKLMNVLLRDMKAVQSAYCWESK